MRPAAGLHRHNVRLHPADEVRHTVTTKTTAQNHGAGFFEPDEAADVLTKINS